MKWTIIAYSRVTWFWLLLDSSSFYRSRDLLSFFHFCSMQSPICIKCTMHTQRKYWIVAEYRCPYGSVFSSPKMSRFSLINFSSHDSSMPFSFITGRKNHLLNQVEKQHKLTLLFRTKIGRTFFEGLVKISRYVYIFIR